MKKTLRKRFEKRMLLKKTENNSDTLNVAFSERSLKTKNVAIVPKPKLYIIRTKEFLSLAILMLIPQYYYYLGLHATCLVENLVEHPQTSGH